MASRRLDVFVCVNTVISGRHHEQNIVLEFTKQSENRIHCSCFWVAMATICKLMLFVNLNQQLNDHHLTIYDFKFNVASYFH